MDLSAVAPNGSSENTPEFSVFKPSTGTICNVDAALCPPCRDLIVRILMPRNTAGADNDNINEDEDLETANPLTHYERPEGLLKSGGQCQLCSLIAREFEFLRTAPFQYNITTNPEKPDVAFYINWLSTDDYDKSGTLPFRLRQLTIPTTEAADEDNHYKLGKLLVTERGIVPVDDAYPNTLEPLEFARQWMDICTTHHSLCHQTRPTTSPLPKLVLDISPHPNDTIFLYETRGDEDHTPYATLTYCWGRGVPLRTLTSNIAQHTREGIPLELFPQTMRDVIPFVRSLGIWYLWIDALCIVQDDPLDWKDQAARMASIYRGCALNVAVADAPSCDSGVVRRLGGSSVRLEMASPTITAADGREDESKGVFLLCEPAFDRHYNPEFQSLISTRGWVLQETLVSPATLYLTHSGLFWHCGRIRFRQGAAHKSLLPLGGGGIRHESTKESWARNVQRWASIAKGSEKAEAEAAGVDPLWALYGWVEQLSRRRLTFARDKLPALAGLAAQLAAVTGARYTAGLWDEDMLLGLTWHVVKGEVGDVQVKTRRRIDLGPSWSWVSVDGNVRWLWCVSVAAKYPAYITPGQEEFDLDIRDIEVDEVFPGSFGEVRRGRITAVGTLYEGMTEPGVAEEPFEFKFDVPFAPEKLTCFFDEEQQRDFGDSPPRKYYLVRIAEIFALFASRHNGGPYLTFLILEHAGGEQENEFSRVGYAHVDQRNGLVRARNEGGERRDIVLV